jgi:hypothetical protein
MSDVRRRNDLAKKGFSGRWSDSVFKKKSEELLVETKNAGLRTSGKVFLCATMARAEFW